jgi:hypothetical protein
VILLTPNDETGSLMKYFSLVVLVALVMVSCGQDPKDALLLVRELNTVGVKHTVSYSGIRPSTINYETFDGSGSRDTTYADSVLRREIDSVKYDDDANTILLTRLTETNGSPIQKDYRKYYFNSDDLLMKITRYGNNKEYTTDSVAYDYTSQTVHYFDLMNKHVFDLVYDGKMNIESETEKRMGDNHVFHTTYFYYDAAKNPFLVNLDDEAFGCFNFNSPGIFWNNASRPIFSSRNNVQSFKEVTNGEEHHGLFEYQYRQGLPVVQFGNESVIYYRYGKSAE